MESTIIKLFIIFIVIVGLCNGQECNECNPVTKFACFSVTQWAQCNDAGEIDLRELKTCATGVCDNLLTGPTPCGTVNGGSCPISPIKQQSQPTGYPTEITTEHPTPSPTTQSATTYHTSTTPVRPRDFCSIQYVKRNPEAASYCMYFLLAQRLEKHPKDQSEEDSRRDRHDGPRNENFKFFF